jgi:DNA-binding Xre family transcriptional regulator
MPMSMSHARKSRVQELSEPVAVSGVNTKILDNTTANKA